MYTSMKRLIEAKFYNTQEEAFKKLDVFYAMNRLTDEEYMELCLLVETVYYVAPPEEPEEEIVIE